MRPMTVLLGIVMGSAVALAVCLAMTGIVFLLLPEYSSRLAQERGPLVQGLLWSWTLAGLSGASFLGELHHSSWRRPAQWLMLALLCVLGWHFWPA
jgi:hypothetical protein